MGIESTRDVILSFDITLDEVRNGFTRTLQDGNGTYFTFKSPPNQNVQNGQVLKYTFTEKGYPGVNGGKAGNLIVQFHVVESGSTSYTTTTSSNRSNNASTNTKRKLTDNKLVLIIGAVCLGVLILTTIASSSDSSKNTAVTTSTPVPTVSEPDYLLSNGKYKYKDDADGNRWYYEYDSDGNFKYKTTTIEYPDWYYGPEKTFRGQTTNYTVSPPTFTDTYEYVKSFDIYVKLTNSTLPSPAKFTVYVQEPKVNSKLYTDEGKMSLIENEPYTYHVELDKPTKVTAVCPRPDATGSFNWTFNIMNLEIISYDY